MLTTEKKKYFKRMQKNFYICVPKLKNVLMKPHRILFVCLGNICRSSSAEGVMNHLVSEAGLEDQFVIDSAGILSYHRGECLTAGCVLTLFVEVTNSHIVRVPYRRKTFITSI